jgi:hypothetical protein|tara:strand:- start:13 stop:396 length:384 start_codon:yes stop_codon:yes gene_type:complete
MPDPKIKKTRRPVKKVVTNRKMAKISPAMKLKIAETKKANLIKTNKLLVRQGRKKVTTIPKKPVKKVLTPAQKAKLLALKKRKESDKLEKVTTTPKKKPLSPGERERAARIARRLAVKARIKRNSGN